jgi:hypothetical protein
MKQSFASKTFGARSFRSVTLAGPTVLGPYGVVELQVFCAGEVRAACFLVGAAVGQEFHPGAIVGSCHE